MTVLVVTLFLGSCALLAEVISYGVTGSTIVDNIQSTLISAVAPNLTESSTSLLGDIAISDLPDGIFKSMLQLFESLHNTYVTVFEWLGSYSVNTLGTSVTPLSVFVSVGLFVYISYTLVKWVIPT